MWVPWKPGNPGQQGRPQGGRVSDSAAVARARSAHRKDAHKQLRAGKITKRQHDKLIAEIERKFR